jgi:hypothetical protein
VCGRRCRCCVVTAAVVTVPLPLRPCCVRGDGCDARAIQEMNGVMCGSRPMRVSVATARRIDLPGGAGGGGGGGGGGMGAGGMGFGGGYGGYAAPQLAPQPGVNTTVFVGGVGTGVGTRRPVLAPYVCMRVCRCDRVCMHAAPEIDEAMLRALCEPVGPLYSVKLPPGKNCAFVQYIYAQHAEHAIATLNGAQVRMLPQRRGAV